MNLADAIRKAAVSNASIGNRLEASWLSNNSQPFARDLIPMPPISDTQQMELDEEIVQELEARSEKDASSSGAKGLVRIELFLSPDELPKLLRSVVATQHSVLTLREAANHLRISIARLEELAKNGEVSGFMVDGKWRFSRQKLDEMDTQIHSAKEQTN